MVSSLRLPFVVALLLAPPAVHAGDALKVEVVPKALAPETPQLVVKAEVQLESVSIRLVRSTDRRRIQDKSGPIAAGREHRFPLKMSRPGKARFTGTLSVQMESGGGEMPIDVEVEQLGPLKLTIASADVDTKKRTLKVSANRGVKKVQVSVMSDVGTPLGTTERQWGGDVVPGGEKMEVKWKQGPGNVMRITVQAWDENGFFGIVELFPWRVDIPHEEVNFASGSHEIQASEQEKLEESLSKIEGAIEKYGALAKIRLFVAGHTDTVADSAFNRTLSRSRARSIGLWFKKQGVKIPLLYAGFGEDMLMVETPDNTDEPKNRRAEYIVAVDPPPIIGGVRWTPL